MNDNVEKESKVAIDRSAKPKAQKLSIIQLIEMKKKELEALRSGRAKKTFTA